VAAFSVVGVLLLAPLARDGGLARGLLIVHLVVVAAVTAIVTMGSKLAQRDKPSGPSPDAERSQQVEAEPSNKRRVWPVDLVAAAGAALYLLTFLLVFLVQPDPGRRGSGALPWFTATVVWTFLVQAGLLVVLLVLTALIGSSTRRRDHEQAPQEPWDPAPGRDGKALPVRWGPAGLGTPAVAMLAWLLAGGFGAGLTLRAAGFLGKPTATPVQPGQPSGALVVPAPYFWTAALTLVVVAATLVALLPLVLRWRAFRRQAFQWLSDGWQGGSTAPESISSEERTRKARLLSIAGNWARARLTDEAGPVVGSLLIVIAALVVAGCVVYGWRGSAWLPRNLNWLTTAGSFAVGALTLWLIAVGRNAYRSPGLRRTVGILWDVGTFWPRAVHPLAPPCYAERVIPDLLDRVRWLAPGDDDVVVVSPHSQGTVIAAALVLQLEPEERRHVRLLTYGSPLQRVFARYFPAYFGPVVLRRIGQVLPARQLADQPDGTAATGATWSWRNLYRPSDPIGGAVFYAYPISARDNGDVDWQLMDPAIDPAMGDRAWPRAFGHSNYFRDPAFNAAYRILEGRPSEGPQAGATAGTDAEGPAEDHPVLSSDASG
jgi:hypothetical protein